MNITGQTDNLADIINLKEYLPANVRLADKSFDGKITATVYIEPIATKDLTVAAENITVTGVPDGMEAEITTTAETYDITVSGLDRDVSILRDSSVTGIESDAMDGGQQCGRTDTGQLYHPGNL